MRSRDFIKRTIQQLYYFSFIMRSVTLEETRIHAVGTNQLPPRQITDVIYSGDYFC